jgi:hypothetical protein
MGLVFSVVSAAEAEFRSELEAAGNGEIVEGNEVEARKNATFDALSNALVDYLEEGLGDEVMREYASLINRKVLPRAEDLVENFVVISEESTDGTFSVFLSVKFNWDLVEDLLRDSGVPLDRGENTRVYSPQATDLSGGELLSVVLEGDGALADSLSLERYMLENVPGVVSVRTARLAQSRVGFEVAFRGDPSVLAERLSGGWAPFQVESIFDGGNTIRVRQRGYTRPPDVLQQSSEKNTQ